RALTEGYAKPRNFAAKTGDGGGPYDDDHLDDEFYWAAAELYITTEKPAYKDVITKSACFKSVDADWKENGKHLGMYTSMTWGDTQALGSISLAVAPNGLGKDVIETIKQKVILVQDKHTAAL